MPFGISTHIFLPERLNPGHLDSLHHAGAESIEVFASRHHFDYTLRNAVRELSIWFRANPVAATMHMPIFTESEETQWSRHTEPTLNLVSRNKSERILAMDEVKRALEAAEQIPFRSCVLHLGLKDDRWSTETLDLSLTAIEHLKAFAAPLGVQLLLENIQNDLATPAHLVEITRVGHFDTVGFCLDVGHAHLALPMLPDETGYDRSAREQLRERWGDAALKDAIPEAFEILSSRLIELHLHDNNGTRDEHLWPAEATAGKGIDWGLVRSALSHRNYLTANTLEIAYDPTTPPREISRKAAVARRLIETSETT
ncbi:MAG TPA: TIM barrel protein [Acidobacteriaceae bacterium]|nr:TIM barrel protein [Acidobacteriaceae bacterium]